jgi:hypothetical protein
MITSEGVIEHIRACYYKEGSYRALSAKADYSVCALREIVKHGKTPSRKMGKAFGFRRVEGGWERVK